MTLTWIGTMAFGLALAAVGPRATNLDDEAKFGLSDCPPAVQKTLEQEARGAKISAVKKVKEDDKTLYVARAVLGGKNYEIRVAESGLLAQIDLELGDEEVPFRICPEPVQATFKRESHDAKIGVVNRDLRYGVVVFEAVAVINGKDYSIVVSKDGTLVEKALVVVEDDIELAQCPAAVANSLREHAHGGKIGAITRSSGISGVVFEAELTVGEKEYVVQVTEGGGLISKALLEDDGS